MKPYLNLIALFLAFVAVSYGQTPSHTPTQTAAPESIRNFGSSLKKYENKEKQNFQGKQKSDESDDGETIRVKTDLVVTDVLVTDQKGNVITDLKKEDFIVTENSVTQTIELFSLGESANIPRSIVLIMDFYAMQAPYLKNSIEAAKFLVDKLSPQDKMAIVTTDIKLQIDFSNDKVLLKKKLDSLEKYATDNWESFKNGTSGKAREFLNSLKIKKGATFGSGAEFETLLAVLNEMFTANDRRPIIIFQGDGNEIIWLKPDSDAPYPISKSTRDNSGMRYLREKAMRSFGFGELKEAIESSRTTIFSVVMGIRFLGLSKKEQKSRAKIAFENTYRALGFNEKYLLTMTRYFQDRDIEIHTAGQTAMSRVAEISGGSTDYIEKPEDAENVYANIFENIKNRYVIGYYPTNQKQDGKRREVKIEVRNHPEYVVTGRRNYLPR